MSLSYSKVIHDKIKLLGDVMDDIRGTEIMMSHTSDPQLLLQYIKELEDLRLELNSVSSRCEILIGAYMEDCKANDIPILLDYARVHKELVKAKGII